MGARRDSAAAPRPHRRRRARHRPSSPLRRRERRSSVGSGWLACTPLPERRRSFMRSRIEDFLTTETSLRPGARASDRIPPHPRFNNRHRSAVDNSYRNDVCGRPPVGCDESSRRNPGRSDQGDPWTAREHRRGRAGLADRRRPTPLREQNSPAGLTPGAGWLPFAPATSRGCGCVALEKPVWGVSSVGRALQWHCRGQEFDSPTLHHPPRRLRTTAVFFVRAHRNRSAQCGDGGGR